MKGLLQQCNRPFTEVKMKNKFTITALIIILTCCAACSKSKSLDQVDTISIGETFSDSSEVVEGTMTFTVNRAEVSSNMKDLGVDPYSIEGPDNFVWYYDENGKFTSILYPDYVNLENGQLKDGFVFVLVDITATNIDATSKTTGDGSGDFDSDYMFLSSRLYLSDLAQKELNDKGKELSTYMTVRQLWCSQQDIRGYYELCPGESKNFQLGFVIHCTAEDYGSLYLTNTSMLDLDTPDLVLVDLGLGTNG